MDRLRHYWLVYREFVATRFAEAMTYRAHFVLMLVMEVVFYVTSLASVDFLYGHVERVGIWNREQFLFFVSYMIAVDQVHMTFISEGYWIFGENVRTGKLDFDLLRPLHLFFSVFFRFPRAAGMLLLPVTWGLVVWYGVAAGLPWWSWPLLPPLQVLSVALLVTFEVLLCSVMFVTVDGTGINFLRMHLQAVSRWPDFIYSPWPRRVMTFVVPILLIGNAPVRLLFDPTDSLPLLTLIPVLGLFMLLNRVCWGRALAGYSSASS